MTGKPSHNPDQADVLDYEQVEPIIKQQPYPLVFVTVSGAHLYGFASPDSDVDLRGVHLLPARELVSLDPEEETVELSRTDDGLEVDLVTHDLEKFIQLMLKRNGYVLEQLYSPLVIQTGEIHEELRRLGHGCITRHHVNHYLGFARNQQKVLLKDEPPRVKSLLYVYRVFLTGIHLMQTGEIEANLLRLNERFGLSYVDELVHRKREGSEDERLTEADLEFHKSEFQRLEATLEQAGQETALPDQPSSRDALNEFLVSVRLD